jgi:hypothetical protein
MYGARIRWLAANGGELRTSHGLFWGTEPAGRLDDPRGRRLDEFCPGAVLAGIAPGEVETAGRREHVFLYVDPSGGAADTIGPLRLGRRVPGYASADAAVELPRITSVVPTIEIRMEPTADRWCDLGLVFAPTCSNADLSSTPGISAFVRLRDIGSGEVYELGLPSFSANTEHHVGGIPCAVYQLSWETTNHYYRTPPDESFVDLSGPTGAIVLDTSRLGCVQFAAFEPDGSPYVGVLYLAIQRVEEDTRAGRYFQRFSAAPYVCDNFPRGAFEASIRFPEHLAASPPVRFECGPGSLALCSFRR